MVLLVGGVVLGLGLVVVLQARHQLSNLVDLLGQVVSSGVSNHRPDQVSTNVHAGLLHTREVGGVDVLMGEGHDDAAGCTSRDETADGLSGGELRGLGGLDLGHDVLQFG